MGNPLVHWFNTRRRRRGLIVAYLVLLALFPMLTWATSGLWAVGALLLVVVNASLLLAGVVGGLFDRPLSVLDERERHLRRSVFANPYFVGVTAGIAAGLMMAATTGSNHPALTGGAVAVLMAVFALPTIVLAWRLPDEVDDDE